MQQPVRSDICKWVIFDICLASLEERKQKIVLYQPRGACWLQMRGALMRQRVNSARYAYSSCSVSQLTNSGAMVQRISTGQQQQQHLQQLVVVRKPSSCAGRQAVVSLLGGPTFSCENNFDSVVSQLARRRLFSPREATRNEWTWLLCESTCL